MPWTVPREPYAQIVGIGANNDGFTEKGVTFPSSVAQAELAIQVPPCSSPPHWVPCCALNRCCARRARCALNRGCSLWAAGHAAGEVEASLRRKREQQLGGRGSATSCGSCGGPATAGLRCSLPASQRAAGSQGLLGLDLGSRHGVVVRGGWRFYRAEEQS